MNVGEADSVEAGGRLYDVYSIERSLQTRYEDESDVVHVGTSDVREWISPELLLPVAWAEAKTSQAGEEWGRYSGTLTEVSGDP